MTAEQIHLIRKSYTRVEATGQVAALVFYRRLFEIAPALKPLFKTDIEAQSEKLTEMLTAAVAMLSKPGELQSTLEALGARHVSYGAKPEHYEIVGVALLDMLTTILGKEFTSEVREAWTLLLSEISNAMLAGAARVETSRNV